MSIIATAVKHLMAAGVTGDALIAAIADMEEQVRGEPKPRSSGAIRQERYRRNKASQVTESDDCDVTPSPLCPPLDKEIPPTPPKEINPPPISPQPDTPDGVVDCEQSPPVTSVELIDAWNLTAEKHGLPRVSKLSDQRKAKIRTFLRNNTIEEIQQGLAAIERSRWLRGENDRGWKADFDFFLQPKSFTKLIEGSYDH